MIYTDEKFIAQTIKKRDQNAHKGNFGKVLIFAGSAGMAGAAVLCAKAALKSGSGLVRFLLPSLEDPIYPILQVGVCEATCVSFKPGMNFNEYDAIAAGSGLGKGSDRLKILSAIIETYEGKLVLDADALNILSSNEHLSKLVLNSKADIVLTPHIGEAKRLIAAKKEEPGEISSPEERKEAAAFLARKYGCCVVLKGHGTLVSKIDGKEVLIYENTTGNAGMATGGSGDVLSGVIASILGQGYDATAAARVGVYIHGLAGDLAADDKGQMGMTALDIVENVPYALKKYC